jgi:hypothetical protein
METPLKQNATKIATKWAFIYLITAIVITYACQFLNVPSDSGLKYLSFIPFIAFLLMAQKEYRDELGGYISFGDAFSSGFRYSVFSGLLLAVFTYLYLTILSPDVYAKSLDASRAQMEAKNLSSAQIDQGMEIAKKWGPLIGSFFIAIMYAIVGAIIALIGAAIFKKERSPFDIAENAIDPTETNV